ELATAGRCALRWHGDKSDIITARELKPGNTIVVPASYGGMRSGCFDASSTEAVTDRAEQASLFARAKPVLRLLPVIAEKLGLSSPFDDTDAVRTALGHLASNGELPEWKRLWAQKLAKSRGSLVVPGERGWTVMEAKRVPLAELRSV